VSSGNDSVIRLFGVPMDLGQGRRGVDMGPSAVRYAGLQGRLQRLGYTVIDNGNLTVAQVEQLTDDPKSAEAHGQAHYLREVGAVCQTIYRNTVECVQAHERVIFVGGDHSISIGTVSGIVRKEPLGLIWIDAHGDLNTPQTTPSGNVHGMPVAALLGHGPSVLTQIGNSDPKIKPEQLVMIGLRDLDPYERGMIRDLGINVFTMRRIDEKGIADVVHEALDYLSDFAHLHVSFDLDSLDPDIAPGVGTPVPGGLSYREAHLLMELLADSGQVRSLDIVEINTILDNQNATAKIAVELAASLFGQRIL
jgi:arginase